jgi:hypothetical protein
MAAFEEPTDEARVVVEVAAVEARFSRVRMPHSLSLSS